MTDYEGAAAHRLCATGWTAAASCGPNGGNCVEVNLHTPGTIGVRDGTRPGDPVLTFPAVPWRAFLAAARAGRFDLR
jgi:hypothetical protein